MECTRVLLTCPLTPLFKTCGIAVTGHITSIDAGHFHTILRDDTGKLYGWGLAEDGQLGDILETVGGQMPPINSIARLDLGNSMPRVRAHACGRFHSVAVATDGLLWAWGRGDNHQLGPGPGRKGIHVNPLPIDLPEGELVVDVSAGWGHNMVLTQHGRVFTWGWNGEAQLGVHVDPVKSIEGAVHGHGIVEVVELHPRNMLQGDRVVQVVSGLDHSLAVTAQGHVWAWGYNEYGQCGGSISNASPVRQVLGLPEAIVQVAAGWAHTVALSEAGNVYAWGNNENGQCGIEGEFTSTPVLLDSISGVQVTQIACGRMHTCAVSVEGIIASWGYGMQGRLGHGDSESCPEPTAIDELADERTVLVACGLDHTVVVTEDHHHHHHHNDSTSTSDTAGVQ